MKKKGLNVALDLLSERTSFFEVILIVLLLALGTNMLAIYMQNKISDNATIIIGSILCVVPLGYLVKRLLSVMQRSVVLEGFLVYDKTNNIVLPVARYDVSEKINSYLIDAFAENTAYKSIWETEKLTTEFDHDEKTGQYTPKCPRTYTLVREAIEYYVLNSLSKTLSIHFGGSKLDGDKIRSLERKDIPDVLLSNRFLELFSKPMEERPLFHHMAKRDPNTPGNITYAKITSGGVFHYFELVLPKDVKVSRRDSSEIKIESSIFTLTAEVIFDGGCSQLPYKFLEYYVRTPSCTDVFYFEVKLNINFKVHALLRGASWAYYQWVDLFTERLSEGLAKARFMETIEWQKAVTILESKKP